LVRFLKTFFFWGPGESSARLIFQDSHFYKLPRFHVPKFNSHDCPLPHTKTHKKCPVFQFANLDLPRVSGFYPSPLRSVISLAHWALKPCWRFASCLGFATVDRSLRPCAAVFVLVLDHASVYSFSNPSPDFYFSLSCSGYFTARLIDPGSIMIDCQSLFFGLVNSDNSFFSLSNCAKLPPHPHTFPYFVLSSSPVARRLSLPLHLFGASSGFLFRFSVQRLSLLERIFPPRSSFYPFCVSTEQFPVVQTSPRPSRLRALVSRFLRPGTRPLGDPSHSALAPFFCL